jgi:hypothetical protein
MNKIIFSIEEVSFSPGEIIFEENDQEDNSLYILEKG